MISTPRSWAGAWAGCTGFMMCWGVTDKAKLGAFSKPLWWLGHRWTFSPLYLSSPYILSNQCSDWASEPNSALQSFGVYTPKFWKISRKTMEMMVSPPLVREDWDPKDHAWKHLIFLKRGPSMILWEPLKQGLTILQCSGLPYREVGFFKGFQEIILDKLDPY